VRVLVSGATGLVGKGLTAALEAAGHEVLRLVRRAKGADAHTVGFDIENGAIESEKLEGVDAVVHLAGEGISSQRWTEEFKQKIRDSRVKGTRLLTDALCKLQTPPKTLVCASAVGYYGSRGDEALDEDSGPGDDFLATVCVEWEDAARKAADCGIRVVSTRIGVVLSSDGGALGQMLPPFRLGGGGVMGDGEHYMSWIAHVDLIKAIIFLLENESLSGPINCVSPAPVTNRVFTKTLGRVLMRPTFVPLPASIIKMTFGEMGQALLLASQRATPKKLLNAGFEFDFPDLEEALRHELE